MILSYPNSPKEHSELGKTIMTAVGIARSRWPQLINSHNVTDLVCEVLGIEFSSDEQEAERQWDLLSRFSKAKYSSLLEYIKENKGKDIDLFPHEKLNPNCAEVQKNKPFKSSKAYAKRQKNIPQNQPELFQDDQVADNQDNKNTLIWNTSLF